MKWINIITVSTKTRILITIALFSTFCVYYIESCMCQSKPKLLFYGMGHYLILYICANFYVRGTLISNDNNRPFCYSWQLLYCFTAKNIFYISVHRILITIALFSTFRVYYIESCMCQSKPKLLFYRRGHNNSSLYIKTWQSCHIIPDQNKSRALCPRLFIKKVHAMSKSVKSKKPAKDKITSKVGQELASGTQSKTAHDEFRCNSGFVSDHQGELGRETMVGYIQSVSTPKKVGRIRNTAISNCSAKVLLYRECVSRPQNAASWPSAKPRKQR